jgi:hypothetical protein
MKSVGKPDALVGHVRFDERGRETEPLAKPQRRRALPRLYYGSRNAWVARSLGWKVHMRCADGYREGTRSMRRCVYRKQLDLDTVVCTRGPNFPLSRLDWRRKSARDGCL